MLKNFEQSLLSAIDGIHAAAIGDTTWSVALEEVCEFVGARAADLNMVDARTQDYIAFHPARIDPFVLRYIADYMSDVSHENPRSERIYLPMPEGKIIADSEVWTPREMREMPFFADFLQPWGTHDSLNTWVRRRDDGTPWVALAMHFSKEDCPPQAEERRRLGMLLPHLRRACGVEDRLRRSQQTASDLRETLAHVPDPILLVDERAKVFHANQAATSLLREENGIRLTREETVQLQGSRNQDDLLAALARHRAHATTVSGTQPARQIVIERAEAAPLAITVQLLPSARRHASGAVAALFINTQKLVATQDLQMLRDAYGLTPAELLLVTGLMNGGSLKAVAGRQGTSYETVRTHLRRVFEKTGTNRQAALVSFVHSLR